MPPGGGDYLTGFWVEPERVPAEQGGGGDRRGCVRRWLGAAQSFERLAGHGRARHLPGFQSMALSIGPDI